VGRRRRRRDFAGQHYRRRAVIIVGLLSDGLDGSRYRSDFIRLGGVFEPKRRRQAFGGRRLFLFILIGGRLREEKPKTKTRYVNTLSQVVTLLSDVVSVRITIV